MAEGAKKPVKHSASYYRRRAASLEKQRQRAQELADKAEQREYERRKKQVLRYRGSSTHRKKVLAGARARERAQGRSGTLRLNVLGTPKKRKQGVRRPPPRRKASRKTS